MKICIIAVIVLIAPLFVPVSQGKAANIQPSPQWKPLTDEPSRAQLFQDYANQMEKQEYNLESYDYPPDFHFPADAAAERNGTPRVDSWFGIDISHYEGSSFPFQTLRQAKVSFIYVKATQGTSYKDPMFAGNWRALSSLKPYQSIPYGAYHFLSSDPKQSGESQADSFLAFLAENKANPKKNLTPAVDVEWDVTCANCQDRWTTNHRTAQEIIAEVSAFVRRVKQITGRSPLVYTNKSFLESHQISTKAQIARLLNGAGGWIFDLDANDTNLELPNPSKNLPCIVWQFSYQAILPVGFAHPVDVDVFKGSRKDFEEFANSLTP